MKSTKMMLMLLAMFLVAAFSVAQADTIVLTTAPSGSTIVDWSQLGAPGTVLPHAFVALASNGDTATGKFNAPTSNKGELVQQGTDWNGNFAAGEFAVWTTNHGPLTISFGNSYNAIGAFFQQNVFGAFTAQLQAFNGSTLLGTVTENGVSNSTVGTAIFIGALDKTGPNITKVVFSETAGASKTDFAIGTMSLGVPEPGTLVLVGSGLLGLAGFARRRISR
jgi:PEP-CTERM motif